MANKKIAYRIQKLLGRWLDKPVIPPGKTVGYSLVRSERANCQMGRHIKLNTPYFLHNVKCGDYTFLSNHVRIANADIGKFCCIGLRCCIGKGLHPTGGISTHPMFYSPAKQFGISLSKESLFEESKHTYIGNDVYIGDDVFIMDGVTIGDGAMIGAGAVVTKDIPPYAIAVGVPARVIKYRFDPDTIEALLKKQWWNLPESELPKVNKYFWDVKQFLANTPDA